MSFSESILRTLLMCATVVAALYLASYVSNIEERVTTLEDRARNSFVIPRPMPFDIDRFIPDLRKDSK